MESIKICSSIFENRKIKFIEALPNGDAVLIIWIKMLALTGSINDGGKIYITKGTPYTYDSLARQIGRPVEIVTEALKAFESLGMTSVSDGYLCIKNWEKYQNIEKLGKIRAQNRERKRAQRSRESPGEHDKESEREYLGGVGRGRVFLSDRQMDHLLSQMSISEFNKYAEIVADCEEKGKSFRGKTHYQAILDMAEKDRRIRA